MKLVNEFEVAAPVERTWPLLLDVPRVAAALPGASIEPGGADGAGHRGRMKVKLGAVTAQYTGTARLEEVDEDRRVARFEVQGREASGQGTASATITTRLRAAGDRTQVVVETDLHVTGRQAQIGHKLMQDVAGGVLDRFAAGLERELRGEPAPVAAGGEDEALELGGAVVRALRERAIFTGAGLVAGVALGFVAGRARGRR